MAQTINRTYTGIAYTPGTSFAAMNAATLDYPGTLGQLYSKNGITYQLVLFKSTTATIAAGSAVMWSDYDDFVVSAKVADSFRNAPAGIALAAVTAGNYGYIQVAGYTTIAVSTGSITAGDVVVMSSTDGTVAGVAAGTAPTYIPFGLCSVTAASNVVGINLSVPINF